jgi:type VI secretion system secreted protein Hcp
MSGGAIGRTFRLGHRGEEGTTMTRYGLGVAAVACAVVAAALALVAGTFGGGPAQAAPAAPSAGAAGTLSIEGLEGASALEVQSYSWGVTNQATVGTPGGGGGAGKATFSDLVVTRPVDSVSPRLVAAAATGQHFDSATLEVPMRKGVMRYTFDLVLVTGVQHSGSGDAPVETLTLTYGTVAVAAAS